MGNNQSYENLTIEELEKMQINIEHEIEEAKK